MGASSAFSSRPLASRHFGDELLNAPRQPDFVQMIRTKGVGDRLHLSLYPVGKCENFLEVALDGDVQDRPGQAFTDPLLDHRHLIAERVVHLLGDASALLFLRIDQLLQIHAALRLLPPEPSHASDVHTERRRGEHGDCQQPEPPRGPERRKDDNAEREAPSALHSPGWFDAERTNVYLPGGTR